MLECQNLILGFSLSLFTAEALFRPNRWQPKEEWVCVSGGKVKVHRIQGDGDCLFAAVHHQLTFVLKQSVPSVRELRREVSSFLNKAKEDELVAQTIRATAEDDPELQHYRRNENLLVDKFIHRLARTKSFGGAESIYALSQLYEVTIQVYNELDEAIVVGEFPTRIRICYRISGRNNKRLHYDSVLQVQTNDDTIPPPEPSLPRSKSLPPPPPSPQPPASKPVDTSALRPYMENNFKFRDYVEEACPMLRYFIGRTRAAAAPSSGLPCPDYGRQYRQIMVNG